MTGFDALLGVLAVTGALLAWYFQAQLRAMARRHAGAMGEHERQREAELQRQTSRTAALFDRMVEGIIVLGTDDRIRLANHAAGNLFGFAPPALGHTVLEATRQHEVGAIVKRLQGEPEVLHHELRLEGLTGPRFIQVNALALRNPQGRRDGAILVFHDLTRIRQLEAVRQDFVANVSHELRTPLSLIKSAAETLIDGGKNDPTVTSRFLEIIDKHATQLTFLIDDLLLLARLDSGKVELETGPVDLHELVQDVVTDAAALAASKGTMIVNLVPADLVAEADSRRLRQVLSNLIDNAIKYGRACGHVTLTGRRQGPRFVEVSVRDDGPGIPAEARARVFERFFRVDKARSREQGGTGLGLAIVKNVVQAHGGDVRVESTPAEGAEFFFTLPVSTAARPPPAAGAAGAAP